MKHKAHINQLASAAKAPLWDGLRTQPLALIERRHRLVLAGMIVLYALVLFGGLTYKYLHWGQGYDQIDYEQSIWNTTQGRFLEISHYRHTDHLWGMDFIPAILLLVPFYALFPSALTLHVFQVGLMALGAWPVYGIARDRFDGSRLAGLGWAAIYLLYPSLWFVTMGAPWQPRTLAIPALLGAFYMFQRRRWWPYIGLLALAITTRTEVSLAVCAFGLVAAIWRRGWRWALPPLLLGLAWFLLSISYIVPSFYHPDYQPDTVDVNISPEAISGWPGESSQLAYLSHLGGSLEDIILNILTDPIGILNIMFTEEKVIYLFLMLLPLAFLPLLAPDVALIAAPMLAINLLSTRVFQITVREQYQALVIPGLILAAIVGAARLRRWWLRPSSPLLLQRFALIALIAYIAVINLAYKNPVVTTIRYSENPQRIALMEQMRAMVPPDASVAATSFLAPRMLPRRYLYYLPNDKTFPPLERAEYLFIDTRASALRESKFVEQIRASSEWEILADRSDLLLVRRK